MLQVVSIYLEVAYAVMAIQVYYKYMFFKCFSSFQIYVANVVFECYISYTHMLQSYVSKCFICILTLQQVLHVTSVFIRGHEKRA